MLLVPGAESSEHHAYFFTVAEFSESRDDECILREVEILTCTLYADIFFIGILVNVMRDDNILTIRILREKFVPAKPSHVYNDITLRFDNVIGPADDSVCVMRTDIVARIHEPGPTGPEKSDTLLQAANPVRIVTIPFHHLFGPLEVDDVVRCIRVPELIRGTSYVNPRRPDSIA